MNTPFTIKYLRMTITFEQHSIRVSMANGVIHTIEGGTLRDRLDDLYHLTTLRVDFGMREETVVPNTSPGSHDLLDFARQHGGPFTLRDCGKKWPDAQFGSMREKLASLRRRGLLRDLGYGKGGSLSHQWEIAEPQDDNSLTEEPTQEVIENTSPGLDDLLRFAKEFNGAFTVSNCGEKWPDASFAEMREILWSLHRRGLLYDAGKDTCNRQLWMWRAQ